MGSGKGKTRRVQTQVPTPILQGLNKDVAFYLDRWDKFVADGRLGRVPLYKYYLGNASPGVAECEGVPQELFTDAVTVGAITLPKPYKAEDFEVKKLGSSARMSVGLKSNPQSKPAREFSIFRHLDDYITMNDVSYVLNVITEGIDGLLNYSTFFTKTTI